MSLTENRQARSYLTESLNELADAPMAELTRADLVRFRNELAARGLGQRTVNNRLGIVRSLFKAVQRAVTEFEGDLNQAGVRHVYTVLPGGTHSVFVRRSTLYDFLQKVFKPSVGP